MNVVDSSGRLGFFADGANAGFFEQAITDTGRLIVPTVSLLEAFKRGLQQRGEDAALQAAAHRRQGRVVALDAEIALAAAPVGVAHQLPLAASVMPAAARRYAAVLWTQDADFEGIEGVRYIAKTSEAAPPGPKGARRRG